MKSKSYIIILLAIVMYSCNAQTNAVDAKEFETGMSKPSVQLLDVRTPGEFESGHIKGSFMADWNNKAEYNRRVAFMEKTKPVYIYCLVGGRSAAAAKQLRADGFTDVVELKGGINAWKAAGKPLEGKTDTPQMTATVLNNAINGAKTVLVEFGASWCPPCKKMEPVLKNLVDNNPGKFTLVKVDGSRDQDLLELYQVTALPVFILFKDGKQVWRRDGVAEETEIASQL